MKDKRFAELLIKSINLSDKIYLEFNTNIFYPEYEKCKTSLYLLVDDLAKKVSEDLNLNKLWKI